MQKERSTTLVLTVAAIFIAICIVFFVKRFQEVDFHIERLERNLNNNRLTVDDVRQITQSQLSEFITSQNDLNNSNNSSSCKKESISPKNEKEEEEIENNEMAEKIMKTMSHLNKSMIRIIQLNKEDIEEESHAKIEEEIEEEIEKEIKEEIKTPLENIEKDAKDVKNEEEIENIKKE